MLKLRRLLAVLLSVFMLLTAFSSVAAADYVVDIAPNQTGYLVGEESLLSYSIKPGLTVASNAPCWKLGVDNNLSMGKVYYTPIESGSSIARPVMVPSFTSDAFNRLTLPIPTQQLYIRSGDLFSVTINLSIIGSPFNGLSCKNISFYPVNNNISVVGWNGYTIWAIANKDIKISDYYVIHQYNKTFSVTSGTAYKFNEYAVKSYGAAAGNSDLVAAIQTNTTQITGAVNQQGQALQDKIDSQYDVGKAQTDAIGGFGSDMAGGVGEKLGALDYASEVSEQLVSLFSTDPGPAVLTLPSFSLAVEGEEYQIWDATPYNLSDLEYKFGPLITVVRFATVVLVYIAFINYLHGVYVSIVHGKTIEEATDDDS